MPLSIQDFFHLRKQLPVVDVRSEGEYSAGHIPGAFNIPILNNQERIIVGTTYKQTGQHAAIREGFRLVGPRLDGIIEEAERVSNKKELLVYCWRGGMRSGNFCQFINMAGSKAMPLSGGYKAYRQAAIESFRFKAPIILLAGFTGSGKSEVLRALRAQGEQIIDLEALASHKGSAFGGLQMPQQPTTEQFQNDLFEEIFKLDPERRVWVEDESLAIGKIFLPDEFWMMMRRSPLVQMDVGKAIRIDRLVKEYGNSEPAIFLETMGKIVKKLGGQNFKAAKEKLQQGDMASTMDILLTYYDKAYGASIVSRKENLKWTISWDGKDVNAFAKELIQGT